VANPERNFADALAQVCLEQGFVVSKGVLGIKNRTLKIPDYDAISKITSLPGRTVREIVQWTNGKSVNFFAEGLLNGVAYHLTGCGSSANSIKVYREYLALKMDTSNLRLYDGSGLSRLNRISANHLCDFLTYIFHSDIFHTFKSSLPVAGDSGTLKDLCKGQPGENRVFAKSGTMTGIKSYAGYVESISGRKIVFALISSGYSCNQSYVKQQMELLMNALAAL
jgi:D-alanyl-D-alanine carboxypeptidase/D-alanyl-D-alanine-endopeptidase (penicillin-binding protein 4)